MKRKAKIYYTSLDDFWRKEEKLAWLRDNPISKIEFERLEPDAKHNWINQTDNDFETLLPLASKDVKQGKAEEAIFEMFSLGVVTARDEWVYDFDKDFLIEKVNFLIDSYNKDLKTFKRKSKDEIKEEIGNRDKREIKWSRAVINDIAKGKQYKFDETAIQESMYRPFVKASIYFSKELNEMQYQLPYLINAQKENFFICYVAGNRLDFSCFATKYLPNYAIYSLDPAQCLPLNRFEQNSNQPVGNITDWALNQFQTHYGNKSEPPAVAGGSIKTGKKNPSATADGSDKTNGAQITKQDIFYYTYGVLHSPQYRKKYGQNLKREFPRLPFYEDFTNWRDWGRELMDLHINYESQDAFALGRKDLDLTPKQKVKQDDFFADLAEMEKETFTVKPKTKLRADKTNGTIEIDSHTTLTGVPALAWEYKLGNRSALEWILDQYKEKKPSDATIAERFNTYKFEDYKEQVIDLLRRVCNVSVKTMDIVNQMPNAD